MLNRILRKKDVLYLEGGGRVDRRLFGIQFWHMIDGRFDKEGFFGPLPFGGRVWWMRSIIDNDYATYQFKVDRQPDAKPIPAAYQKGRSTGYFFIGLTIAVIQGIIGVTRRAVQWTRHFLTI